MSQVTIVRPNFDPKLIMPFVSAVREVFQQMVGVAITIERPHVKESSGATHDISGIIGFSGQVAGSMVLSFSEEAATRLVEAFAGTPLKCNEPDFADAVGELANMIAGSAKHQLGVSASISVPSVIIGKGFSITAMSGNVCVVLPCQSPVGNFAVEVCIKHSGTAKVD